MNESRNESGRGAGVTPLRDATGGRDARMIPAEQLEQIVRRASELRAQDSDHRPGDLSEEEVVQIGRQVGLDPEHVRRAIAEIHAASLSPAVPPEPALVPALLGPAWVRTRRVVAGSPDAVHRRLAAELGGSEGLRAIRDRGSRSVWQPALGLADRMQRWLDFSGRGYALTEVRSVDVSVAEVEPGWSLVTVTADLDNVRNDLVTGWGIGVLIGVAGLASLIWATDTAVIFKVVGTGLAGLALLAAGVGATRWNLHERRRRFQVVLEGLLDRIES